MIQKITTPAYVVDYETLRQNRDILVDVKKRTGARILLALKAFSMFDSFPIFSDDLDGCCASSLNEARLAHEYFGGEVHVFAAALGRGEMLQLLDYANHFTFNSFAQWRLFQEVAKAAGRPLPHCGLRINPEHSEGDVPLYDPCAPRSRLGILRKDFEGQSLKHLSGLHCHNLCQHNSDALKRTLQAIEKNFSDLIPHFKWFNFGGGHHITRADYDIDLLVATINDFKVRHGNPIIYLEPGEAVALNAGTLVTTVLDVIENEIPIAIMDASCTCHMPDVLEMPYRPRCFRQEDWRGRSHPAPHADRGHEPGDKPYTYRLAGPSCLAGDVIGDYSFAAPLKSGDQIVFEDMAIYTMVKNTTFNGVPLPRIIVREHDDSLRTVREFGYNDFRTRLS